MSLPFILSAYLDLCVILRAEAHLVLSCVGCTGIGQDIHQSLTIQPGSDIQSSVTQRVLCIQESSQFLIISRLDVVYQNLHIVNSSIGATMNTSR